MEPKIPVNSPLTKRKLSLTKSLTFLIFKIYENIKYNNTSICIFLKGSTDFTKVSSWGFGEK